MRISFGPVAVWLCLSLSPASGATINNIIYETRPYAGGPLATANDYIANWAALVAANPTPPAGYGGTAIPAWDNVSNQLVFGGSGTNIAYLTTINFTVAPGDAGVWDFRFGIDFGSGGALVVDGVVRDFRNTDMWWNGSYANPANLLTTSLALAAGSHTILVYGAEACCDGPTQAQYRLPGGSFQTFTTVPEPSTFYALGLGMLGLSLVCRRRRA